MRKSLALAVAGLVACGGPAKGPEGPAAGSGGGPTAKPSGPGDVSFEIQPQEIKGTLFEPEALGSPGMPLVDAKRKTTIEKQRQTFEKTKDPVQKEAHAAILATLLYRKAKDAKGDEQRKLWTDARQVLRDAAQVSGDKVDEITLRLLGSYELLLGDFAAAEKAWGGLVAKAPKDKDLKINKAWWAYSLLKLFKNAEALAAVGSEPIDKTPELAYVAGWAKWRTGDKKGGWNALLTAAKAWGTNPGRDALDNELLLFAGRNELPLEATATALTPAYGKSTDQQYKMYSKLGMQGYLLGGRWADGRASLEKAVTSGAKVPVDDLPAIRYTQADYTVRLDDPVTAAKFAKQAVEALPACGTRCSDKQKNDLVQYVYLMGRLFHVVYATAHDDRYYQPAHDLYALAVPKLTMDDKMRTDAQKEADALERSFKAMKAGVGTHDKGAIGALLTRHNQEVAVCYEQALAANPKLGGTLTLNLETDQTGVIKGAATEPKGGQEGLAAVAACVEAKAKTWKLPTRAQAGSTRIKINYALAAANK